MWARFCFQGDTNFARRTRARKKNEMILVWAPRQITSRKFVRFLVVASMQQKAAANAVGQHHECAFHMRTGQLSYNTDLYNNRHVKLQFHIVQNSCWYTKMYVPTVSNDCMYSAGQLAVGQKLYRKCNISLLTVPRASRNKNTPCNRHIAIIQHARYIW